MDVLGAMRETVALLGDAGNVGSPVPPECDNVHLRGMLDHMEHRHLSDEMSYGKMCRWLGFVQGVLITRGVATLKQLKEINQRHAG